MKFSRILDVRFFDALLLASFFIALFSLPTVGTTMNAIVTNGTSTFSPFDWAIVGNIAPYLSLLIAGLTWLYKRWKNRNWKRKYEKVVVAKPLSS
jgi:uncharacterized BrkB/YihY/UPF0761 family membrane protein